MASTSTDSSREYQDCLISHPTQAYAYPQRRRHAPKPVHRFYSSPVNDSTESTPLEVYGLEQREPSIMEKPKRLQRMSYALDDIKEDFPLNPRMTAEKLMRRTSTFILDSRPTTPDESGGGGSSGGLRSRRMSILSTDNWSPPRRLSRRLSGLSSFSRRKIARNPQNASISQPNLIGSSTQL